MRYLYTLIFFFASLVICYGQNVPNIKISTDKIKQNGVVKYVHSVKQGETLYSISKAYQVSIEELVENNPSLKSGLKDGTALFIPVNPRDTKTNSTVTEKENVKEKEAVKYVATTNSNDNRIEDKTNKAIKHIAKWYESIDDIAQKYGVSKEELMAFNKLKSEELSKRQVLYIPTSKGEILVVDNKYEDQDEKHINDKRNEHRIKQGKGDDEAVKQKNSIVDSIVRSSTVRLAYILPLNSSDSLKTNSNYMDFYFGSLMAINELKSTGLNVDLAIYDQANYRNIQDITLSGSLDDRQAIIGPIRSTSLKEMISFTKIKDIPIISPMDPEAYSLVNENKLFIQAPASIEQQVSNLIEKLASDYHSSGANVLICMQKGYADSSFVRLVKENLVKRHIPYKKISYSILEGRGIADNIAALLVRGKENLVVVPSNSEAFVSDVIRNLNLLNSAERSITLFGMPKWRNFEILEIDLLHKLHLNLSLPYFIDYYSQNTIKFINDYKSFFNGEPTAYSFQGYDITYYFLSELSRDNDVIRKNRMKQMNLIQSNFNFSNQNSTGYINTATKNIIYQSDFTISVVQ